jgi:hypothetical protein
MNTQYEEQDVIPNSAYNPFPEPQTIPSGWDLSALPSPQQPDSLDEDKLAES